MYSWQGRIVTRESNNKINNKRIILIQIIKRKREHTMRIVVLVGSGMIKMEWW